MYAIMLLPYMEKRLIQHISAADAMLIMSVYLQTLSFMIMNQIKSEL